MSSVLIAQIVCGALFLTGLVTGAWKYQAMMADPDGAANGRANLAGLNARSLPRFAAALDAVRRKRSA